MYIIQYYNIFNHFFNDKNKKLKIFYFMKLISAYDKPQNVDFQHCIYNTYYIHK